ncbi:FAD-dependent monooxygenase [Alcaligenes endophyticus]|uniref:FAD-dependent monooxygenase n=1 Tax=Alcaligenes endophyticus TaxID=1929088 RepID=A0ABT8EH40_9BURK|nr:FAD-dependent monooxygenase [Alcaligenes endophyticus]MCX5589730.1 FAD-dependent monooxygenase [Alcaligenes endophyticus]MDN4120606.1 FAD-dependent monooxygenase [Alcaligenes endophyticus]
MSEPSFDIAICGAGPVGASLALLLAKQSKAPERIALLGRAHQTSSAAQRGDPRTLALNFGSQQLLQQLHAWPTKQAPMQWVHVSQQGRLGRCLISAKEMQVPHLGAVVNYDDLLSSLHQALLQSGVTFITTEHAQAVSQAESVLVQHQNAHVHARMAVQCDGTKPQGTTRHYQQHALLATLRASKPQAEWAYERFTEHGPLALLPHPDGHDLYALVWCNPPARTQFLQQASTQEFEQHLQSSFGHRLGTLQLHSRRHVFPLALHAGPSLLAARIAAAGNAAQTLHPVAGQGLNLGLRDVAQLAQALSPWQADTQQPPMPYLQNFAKARRPDRWLTAAITDTLPRLFATRNPLIQHACGLGLLAMDTLPLARLPFARQLLLGLRA